MPVYQFVNSGEQVDLYQKIGQSPSPIPTANLSTILTKLRHASTKDPRTRFYASVLYDGKDEFSEGFLQERPLRGVLGPLKGQTILDFLRSSSRVFSFAEARGSQMFINEAIRNFDTHNKLHLKCTEGFDHVENSHTERLVHSLQLESDSGVKICRTDLFTADKTYNGHFVVELDKLRDNQEWRVTEIQKLIERFNANRLVYHLTGAATLLLPDFLEREKREARIMLDQRTEDVDLHSYCSVLGGLFARTTREINIQESEYRAKHSEESIGTRKIIPSKDVVEGTMKMQELTNNLLQKLWYSRSRSLIIMDSTYWVRKFKKTAEYLAEASKRLPPSPSDYGKEALMDARLYHLGQNLHQLLLQVPLYAEFSRKAFAGL